MQGHWKELRESLGPSRCPSRPWTPTCICLRCQNTELGWLVSVKWTWVSCSQITFNSSPGSMFDEAESNENPWDGSLLKLEMVNRSLPSLSHKSNYTHFATPRGLCWVTKSKQRCFSVQVVKRRSQTMTNIEWNQLTDLMNMFVRLYDGSSHKLYSIRLCYTVYA